MCCRMQVSTHETTDKTRRKRRAPPPARSRHVRAVWAETSWRPRRPRRPDYAMRRTVSRVLVILACPPITPLLSHQGGLSLRPTRWCRHERRAKATSLRPRHTGRTHPAPPLLRCARPRPKALRLELGLDGGAAVGRRGHGLGLLVRDLDVKGLLNGHDQLDSVEAVGAQILGERRARLD